MSEARQEEFTSAGFFMMTVAPMLVWTVWATAYYTFIFVFNENKVRQPPFVLSKVLVQA